MSHNAPTGRASGAADDPSLAKSAANALRWSFVNTAVSRLGTIGIGIVLARVLGVEAFGTFAVATVALIAILSFNELGVSLAIVRWPDDPRDIAPTVTTISVVSSVTLAVIGYAVAPAFAGAMGDPSATGVVRLMLVSLVVNGIVAAPAALLQRNFEQGRRMAIDQVNVWLGAILSVVLALTGMGAMSLAIGRVAGSVVSGVMFVVMSPQPFRFGWDRSKVPALLKFGLPLAGSSIVVFAIGYTDQLTAGSVLGRNALGYYVLAFNLASWPVTLFSQPLRSVAPAAFSRLQHDRARMARSLKSIVGVLAAITVPICFLLAGAANPIIAFVYGAKWALSAPILTWLAILAAFRIFFELAYDFLVVLGRSRAILGVQLVWLVALVPGLIFATKAWGTVGLAAVQVVIAALLILPLYLREFRTAGLTPSEVGSRTWSAVATGMLVGVAALFVARTGLVPVLACLFSGTICLAAIAVLVYRDRTELTALRGMGQ